MYYNMTDSQSRRNTTGGKEPKKGTRSNGARSDGTRNNEKKIQKVKKEW